jgi:hypothetical protein
MVRISKCKSTTRILTLQGITTENTPNSANQSPPNTAARTALPNASAPRQRRRQRTFPALYCYDCPNRTPNSKTYKYTSGWKSHFMRNHLWVYWNNDSRVYICCRMSFSNDQDMLMDHVWESHMGGRIH